MTKKSLILIAFVVFLTGGPVFAESPHAILHTFAGGAGGLSPNTGPLATDGTTLYGTTEWGGAYGSGCIYKIDADGTDFQVLHSFAGGTTDGMRPISNPILAGSWLYGTTFLGGGSGSGSGTVYKIGTDGNNFVLLRAFDVSEGVHPNAGLALLGTTLYGMTYEAGAGCGSCAGGTLFKIDTDGNNYAVVHTFAGGESDGYKGLGLLTVSGSVLYGTTQQGGTSNKGVIFKWDPAGPTLTILHSFAGSAGDDGEAPVGYLLEYNGYLFGMTQKGGAYDKGTVFAYPIDGSIEGAQYHLVHDFQGGASEGDTPSGGLVKASEWFYGFTSAGGSDTAPGPGTMFMVQESGYGFAQLLVFSSGAYGGTSPSGAILCGSKVIGTTRSGGNGTIFSYDITASADVGITEFYPDNSNPVGGTNVTFTITATNNGPYPVTGLKITDHLPEQLTYVSNSATWGTFDSATGIWDIGKLSNGPDYVDDPNEATLTLTARVNSTGTFTNTATITAHSENDPDDTNDQGSVEITTTPTKNLLPPILLSPLNNATGQLSPATLGWRDTNNTPQEIKYKVRIKKAGGAYVNYTLAANTVQYIKSGLAAGKVYYWNVQAVGNGTTTRTSAWANGGADFQFTVAPPVTLLPPTLLTPASGATGQPLSLTLYWGDTNSSPNELKYKVRFKIAGGAYTVTTLGPDVTSLLKTGLKSGKTYYWSVMALGNGTSIKNSVWPADSRFTTGIISLKK